MNQVKRQNGAALAMALVVLLIVTLLAVTSMGTSTLELRMSKNLEDSHLALHGAERRAVDLLQDLANINGAQDEVNLAETTVNGVKTEGSSKKISETATPSDVEGLRFAEDANIGIGSGTFRVNHFNLDLQSETTVGSRKNILVGFAVVAPK